MESRKIVAEVVLVSLLCLAGCKKDLAVSARTPTADAASADDAGSAVLDGSASRDATPPREAGTDEPSDSAPGPTPVTPDGGGPDAAVDVTVPRSCVPGDKQCNGAQPQVCDANGNWQTMGTPCAFVCAAGACTGVCTPSMKKCMALQPQTCAPTGDWQNTGAACTSVCNGGTCAACVPTSKQCNGLQPQACDAAGLWQDTGSACPFVCNTTSGTCAGTCSPGAKQCSGQQPRLCDATGAWQPMGSPCPFVCNTTSGTCAGTCSPGAKRCSNAQPQLCDGSGAWQNMGTPCAFVCNPVTTACAGSCVPGAKQCSGLQPQLCDTTGTWQPMGSACPFACNGTSASCTGTCSAGARRCSTLQPQLCDAAGAWQPMGSPCPFVCNTTNGTCAGTCTPGAKRCNSTQPQVCDAGGAWQAMGTACGVCTPCSMATGTCAPAPGISCSDSNACTTGETCQANGTCGGGILMACNSPPECRTAGTCSAGACTYPVAPAGTSCNNGLGTCVNGTCNTCPTAVNDRWQNYPLSFTSTPWQMQWPPATDPNAVRPSIDSAAPGWLVLPRDSVVRRVQLYPGGYVVSFDVAMAQDQFAFHVDLSGYADRFPALHRLVNRPLEVGGLKYGRSEEWSSFGGWNSQQEALASGFTRLTLYVKGSPRPHQMAAITGSPAIRSLFVDLEPGALDGTLALVGSNLPAYDGSTRTVKIGSLVGCAGLTDAQVQAYYDAGRQF